jgi:hypothetical protein
MKMPKRQPYPASKITIGACLYRAYSYCDEGKAVTGFEEWIVYTIRARRGDKTRSGFDVSGGINKPKAVNLIQKNASTWGKKTKKTGDYGWLPPFHPGYRRQFRVGEDLPSGVYTTKRAALAYELADQIDSVAWYEKEIQQETDQLALAELVVEATETASQVAALKRRMSALAKTKLVL